MLMLIPILASVSSSDYLVTLITRGLLLLFLGPEDLRPSRGTNNSSSLNGTTLPSNLMAGSFHLHSSDNFDAYLSELGVSFILRQLAGLAFPIITVQSCPTPPPPDCQWKIKTDAGLRSHTISFSLGEQVDDVTMDGRQVSSLFSLDDEDSLLEEQRSREGGPTTFLTRRFYDNRMEVGMVVNSVNASSVFLRN
jgi:hypothetical protein